MTWYCFATTQWVLYYSYIKYPLVFLSFSLLCYFRLSKSCLTKIIVIIATIIIINVVFVACVYKYIHQQTQTHTHIKISLLKRFINNITLKIHIHTCKHCSYFHTLVYADIFNLTQVTHRIYYIHLCRAVNVRICCNALSVGGWQRVGVNEYIHVIVFLSCMT